MQVKTTSNYREIQKSFDENQRGIVLAGGTRSSKTIAALQWIIIYCLQNTGKEVGICRDTLTNMKRTTLKDFEALCYGFGYPVALYPDLRVNKSEFTCKINGNTVSFFGLNDDVLRVYGYASDLFYINEAISTYKSTFDQLEQRCRGFWLLDCNPSYPSSWVYELDLRDDVTMFRSTYKDNPFLPTQIVNKIESYEPTPKNIEQGTADLRMWSIYGQGLIFKGKEIIYPNWTTYKDEPDGWDYLGYGVDWGFSHPMACIRVIIDGNDLYLREVFYRSGVDGEDLLSELADVLLKEPEIDDRLVVCDSAEPKSINFLRFRGIPATAVKKKHGGVIQGIRLVNSYNIKVHEDSKNLQKELNNYKFKVDKATDTVLEVPVKEWDDGLDSARYLLTHIS